MKSVVITGGNKGIGLETTKLFLDAGYSVIPEESVAQLEKAAFTARIAQPQEVAQTIFWLGTDAPAQMTGACIDINGGAYVR